jgi:hypothetical protein
MPKYLLGKKPRAIDPRTLRLARYLTPGMPPPPPSVAWQNVSPAGGWGMDSNATLGDCVVAAAAHQIEAWTYNADPSRPVNVTESQVVSLYRTVSPDNDGVVILDFLRDWREGIPLGPGSDALLAFAAVNPAVTTEVEQAVDLFGGAFVGLELPNAVVQSPDALTTPWTVPPSGAVGPDWAPNPQNGHCVPVLGYTASELTVVTWGAVKTASWEFLQAYCDEAYALLSATDWIENGGRSPSGFDLAQLRTDLAAIGPAPSPAPTSSAARAAPRGRSPRGPRRRRGHGE